MLAFITGRLDVEGGNLNPTGSTRARAGAFAAERSYADTEFGVLRRGGLPGTLMSCAVLDGEQR